MTEEERRRRERIRARKRKRRRKRMIRRICIIAAMFIIAVLILVLGFFLVRGIVRSISGHKGSSTGSGTEVAETVVEEEEQADPRQDILDQADYIAKGYDYDGAIDILESYEGWEDDEEINALITEYKEADDAMVPVDMDKITHIFYHSLVVDTERAFTGDGADGFKEWMTTTYEFDEITQEMYDRGFVLISLNDMITRTYDEDGTVHIAKNENLRLPEGKTPFVLSLDDLSYYHSYDGHGIASRLILDDEGKITCEYYDADGNYHTGDYDCLPRMNTFLEEHPDGAYHGARGTIALTGYDGILGYRTDTAYQVIDEHTTSDQQAWLDAHPDFDFDEECAEAVKIADEIKAEGWTFASHTWGHLRISDRSYERIVADTEKWISRVEPLIGDTDIIIFAHGQDLTGSGYYDASTNEKYAYLKSQGFNVYCNVDSNQYFIQYRDDYLRMGRRNLDGYRLWTDAHNSDSDHTSDLIDVQKCLDPARTDMPEL